MGTGCGLDLKLRMWRELIKILETLYHIKSASAVLLCGDYVVTHLSSSFGAVLFLDVLDIFVHSLSSVSAHLASTRGLGIRNSGNYARVH